LCTCIGTDWWKYYFCAVYDAKWWSSVTLGIISGLFINFRVLLNVRSPNRFFYRLVNKI
jgi:hypothetical protein